MSRTPITASTASNARVIIAGDDDAHSTLLWSSKSTIVDLGCGPAGTGWRGEQRCHVCGAPYETEAEPATISFNCPRKRLAVSSAHWRLLGRLGTVFFQATNARYNRGQGAGGPQTPATILHGIWTGLGPLRPQKSALSGSRHRPILKTQQSNFRTYLMHRYFFHDQHSSVRRSQRGGLSAPTKPLTSKPQKRNVFAACRASQAIRIQ